jgi:hypothetical protein
MASVTVTLAQKSTPDGDLLLQATYTDTNNQLDNLTVIKPINATPTLFVRDPSTNTVLFQETEPAGQTTIVHTVNGYKVQFDSEGDLQVPYEFQFG